MRHSKEDNEKDDQPKKERRDSPPAKTKLGGAQMASDKKKRDRNDDDQPRKDRRIAPAKKKAALKKRTPQKPTRKPRA